MSENDYLTTAIDLAEGTKWHKNNPTDSLLAAQLCALIDIAESLRTLRPDPEPPDVPAEGIEHIGEQDMITDHRFVGKREWGINPPDNAPCQYQTTKTNHPSGICDYPKNQHQVICPSVLIIKGESFGCDVVPPHDGWPHGNSKAEAVWGSGRKVNKA